MYIIQRGAQLEGHDIYGNTPLGVGLMYQHYNYGIILIQKGAKVHPMTFREDHERIKKMWEEEEKAKRGPKTGEDAEMEDSEKPKFAKHTQKKHQNMFQRGLQYVDEYGDEEEDEDEESEDEDDQHRENVFN